MKEINFNYNWCEYLTPCPYNKNIDVGSYECCMCEFNKGINQEEFEIDNNILPSSPIYMKRYFIQGNGIVKCNHFNSFLI